MDNLPDDLIALCREYVFHVEMMDGKRTSKVDMATLDIERADLHNQILARLQGARIEYGERGDVTDWAFKVVKWCGR